MTSPAAQAVERERFNKLLDEYGSACAAIGRGEGNRDREDKARIAVRSAFDARAESRTAEQGAELKQLDPYIGREDGGPLYTAGQLAEALAIRPGKVVFVPDSERIEQAVAAATRAARDFLQEVMDSIDGRTVIPVARLDAMREFLADALPAEAPEGREPVVWRVTSKMNGRSYVTQHRDDAGDIAAQLADEGDEPTIEALGVIAASPEAAQPAASERDAFESWARGWHPISLFRHEGGGYANGAVHEKWCAWQARAALAQATPQAPEGEPETFSDCIAIARKSLCYWLERAALIAETHGRRAAPKLIRDLLNEAQSDAALANKENAE